jgi:hypothetical protein
VDDTIGGGTAAFYQVMEDVEKDLKLGSVEHSNFHYKGLRISTVSSRGSHDDSFEIVIDGDEYLDCLLPMEVPAGNGDERLVPSTAVDFMSVVGYINYVASAFRPDVALEASILGRAFVHPTIRDARKANVLRCAGHEHDWMRGPADAQ